VSGKILFGVPTYDGRIHTASVQSLIHLASTARKMGYDTSIQFVNHVMVDVARDALASMVLADERITHLCMLDSDVSFGPDVAERMLSRVYGSGKYHVLAGLYPRRGQVPASFDRMVLHVTEEPEIDTSGCVEVLAAPTGLMIIQRQVIQSLTLRATQRYHNQYTSRDCARVFDFGINEAGEMEGEDFRFCRKARKAGFQVFALTGLHTTHEGWFKYSGEWKP
jgi:hypothetical protein